MGRQLVFLALVLSVRFPSRLSAQDSAAPELQTKPSQNLPASSSATSIADENTLVKAGKRPFHLKLSFQVFDLSGKPGEKGTIESWWAESEGSHLQISTPSLGTVDSLRPDTSPTPSARRSLFLAGELLNDVENPGSYLILARNTVQTEERVVGTMVMECMHKALPPSAPALPPTQVCADSTTGNIRLIEGPSLRIVRNHPGAFAGTQVDVDTSVSWGGLQAITGHIDELQSFNPANSTVTLKEPAISNTSNATPPDSVRLASGVIAGRKIGGSQPSYPMLARQNRIHGTVTLEAVISKEGTVENLFALSSPDPLLTDAAIDAVKNWTYSPYLLNGSPTEVSTTITVNFNMSSGFR